MSLFSLPYLIFLYLLIFFKGFKYKSQTLKLKPVSMKILNPHSSIPFHCNSQPIRLLMGVHHNSISLHYDDTNEQ
jgi:hypothetical protein